MNQTLERIRADHPAGSIERETSWNGSAFVYGLVCLFRPERVIEVGCSIGTTSAYIMEALTQIGSGSFIGYEKLPGRAREAEERLQAGYPGGAWSIVQGDFFRTYDSQTIDFAFIDLDPKEHYIRAVDSLVVRPGGVLVLHDLEFAPDPVGMAAAELKDRGYIVSGFVPERGFAVAIKP
jgi:predicted O-methyltransferase YrrM